MLSRKAQVQLPAPIWWAKLTIAPLPRDPISMDTRNILDVHTGKTLIYVTYQF